MSAQGIAKRSSPWLAALLVLATAGAGRSAAAPAIVITNLPAYGSTDNLAGIVLNTAPAACAVAVFIEVPDAGWWSKPTCPGQPLTSIMPDGNWTADITTGGADLNATRVAALLVGTNYNQPCVLGAPALPTNVYAQALAAAIVTRPQPGVRWLSFSGYDWWVKTSPDKVGPGPNYFSDSASNVWVDAQGWLHLRVTNRSNHWQCAEIVSARTFGCGSYRLELNSPVNDLDPNAVLGLFTWSDDPAYADREIDIECSRWGNAADSNNAQYVVQPYNVPGQLVRYQAPAGLTNSTHLFTWETNRVSFQSQRGGFVSNPDATNVISSWNFTNSAAVPQTGDENMRLNLWLYKGYAPAAGQEVEFVIKSFNFVPLGAPPPSVLGPPRGLPGGLLRFDIGGQPDWRYQVQSSVDFLDWQDLGALLATNSVIGFRDTNAAGFNRRFYRALTLP